MATALSLVLKVNEMANEFSLKDEQDGEGCKLYFWR